MARVIMQLVESGTVVSFSNAFIFIWGLVVFFTAISLCFENRPWVAAYNACSYWFIAILLVAFAGLRPIGSARDDLNYVEIYSGICPTVECGLWVQGARDWGWYSILGFFKQWVPGTELMLWLSAFALLVKFWVIFRLNRRQALMGMLLFLGLFYEVLDLTAFRVAVSSTLFMLGILFLTEKRFISGSFLSLVCWLFHKQGVLAPLVLLGPLLKRNYLLFVTLVVLPVILMSLGMFPNVASFFQTTNLGEVGNFAVKDGLDNFFSRNYVGWRVAPIVYYPLLVLGVWLAKDVILQSSLVYVYTSISIVWAAWFLWGFASLPDVQVRLFDFMILPIVFLAGMCKFDWQRLLGVTIVSGVFVVKYNVLHPLLTGGFLF